MMLVAAGGVPHRAGGADPASDGIGRDSDAPTHFAGRAQCEMKARRRFEPTRCVEKLRRARPKNPDAGIERLPTASKPAPLTAGCSRRALSSAW